MINHFYWLASSGSKWNSLGISQVSHSVIESGQAVTDWCGFHPAPDTWWGHHSFSAVVTAHHRHRSHRRLNFHLKCDWDVIVSSIGLLWGTATQLIPFYPCRLPTFSPRQSRNDHRSVILPLNLLLPVSLLVYIDWYGFRCSLVISRPQ